MKKLLILVLGLSVLLVGTSLSFATQRVVLGEMFTSTGTSSCAEAEAALDQLVETYPDRLAVIRYHQGPNDLLPV